MALRGKKPEAVTKRLKLFMFGPAGVGKSTAAIQFPNAYIIDGEKGTENYDALINAAGSVVFRTNDAFEVVEEVKALLTEKHEFRTLVIDPITPIYNDLIEKAEVKVGTEFGRHYGEANKTMKRLSNLIMSLDMNVIITAHAKKEYGTNLTVLGQTFDGWRSLDYWFDLVVELDKKGKRRIGRIKKTRLAAFPDGEAFDWSYAEIRNRWNVDVLERAANAVDLARPEQIDQVTKLLAAVRLPEGTVGKWFSKAGVDAWDDMPAAVIAKCIEYIKSRLPASAAA
jgi:hypothetical protein